MSERVQAIDVLRGLTLALMITVNRSIDEASYSQLLHAQWFGLTLTDLVFPTFLFVVGNALSLTLERNQQLGDRAVLLRIARRVALIFLCGYLLYWFPFLQTDASGHWMLQPIRGTRVLGVLQRIALCYGTAALILHYGGKRGAWIYGLLVLPAYWVVLQLFGDLTLTGNAVLRLDRALLGEAHLYRGDGVPFDPEGLLSTAPAVVNVLAGYLAGSLLRTKGRTFETLTRLLLAGGACIVVGLGWSAMFPICKNLWTSSYVMCTIGVDLYALALLVYCIDLKGQRGWAQGFEVLGRNTLFIYLLSEMGNTLMNLIRVHGQDLFTWIYERGFHPWAGAANGALLYALAYLLCCWMVAWWLDRRRIYIRL